MASEHEDSPGVARQRRREGAARLARRVVVFAGLAVLALIGGLWLSRERIADNVIAAQLEKMGLPATYRIERIGGARQVLGNIRVGNPARPDLVIERAEVEILYPLGLPRIGSVKLVRPRLYGTYQGGRLSFGALDTVLFPKKPRAEPARLPDLTVELVDGRAKLATDHGSVGFWAEGTGNLRNGFAAKIAALAPQMQVGDCALQAASLYGTLAIAAESPRFNGPIRLAAARCAASGGQLQNAALQLEAQADKAFESFSGKGKLRTRQASAAGLLAHSLALDGQATWRAGALNARIAGDLGGVETPAAAIALLGVEGRLRTREAFEKLEFQGTLDGRGIAPGTGLERSLASAEAVSADTLLAPMIAQLRLALRQERPGSRLTADFTWRTSPSVSSADAKGGAGLLPVQPQAGGYTLVVPSAQLRGGSGETLVSLSRFQLSAGRGESPRITGNFSTGGRGLPRIVGRMEQDAGASAQFRLAMAPYHAGGGEIAIPRLSVVQAATGGLGFAGEVRLSGALPGGSARNLVLPVDGGLSPRGDFSVFRGCITPRFDSLTFANLVIERRSVTICPGPGQAIVTSDSQGTRVAAGVTALDLAGRLGETPIRMRSGPVGFALAAGQSAPGTLAARQLDVELGPLDTATRFRLSDLSARIGSAVTGTFAGAEAQLFSVPLDIVNAGGNWTFDGQRLSIAGGRFELLDRKDPDRFHPLVAQGAALSLEANRIDARAVLREPVSDRDVVATTIRHDLASGIGHADLVMTGLTFDKALQPDRITPLALGVVANVAGEVRGRGSIEWTPSGVTSRGAFSSDNLDFAAAFGPVKGVSGTVRFTDLLGLVTEPGQRLKVASINPGIEVTDGEVAFALRPGYLLKVEGGRWPFLGGTLTLRPVDLNLGLAETRRYVLAIEGLDAGKFVQHMDLENISASGTFDGEVPLVFDSFGGRVEGGLLISRPPGGNLSYVGALTYKDLSAMANFAFDALRSLDYRHMTIAMDGALEGEIVTRVRFDGVRQGAGARRNFVTRAISKLPVQFNINIRAPFYRLITSVKAMYDPAFIEDPRTLGLVDSAGRPLRNGAKGVRAAGSAVIALPVPSDSPPPVGVQSPESGKMP